MYGSPIQDLWSASHRSYASLFCFVLFFPVSCLLRAAPVAFGGSLARGLIGAVAANLRHSHSHARSKLCLQPTPWLTPTLDPNPLSEARDRTDNLLVPSRIRFHCTTTGTPHPCYHWRVQSLKVTVPYNLICLKKQNSCKSNLVLYFPYFFFSKFFFGPIPTSFLLSVVILLVQVFDIPDCWGLSWPRCAGFQTVGFWGSQ